MATTTLSSSSVSSLLQEFQSSHSISTIDDTLPQYIETILLGGNKDDILESIPPLLLESYVNSKEEAEKLTISWLQRLGLIKDSEIERLAASNNSGAVALLRSPLNIAQVSQIQEKNEADPFSKPKNGNTYEVVNIGAKPVEDEDEACVSLHAFLELTRHEDPIIRKKALRELCPCHVKHDVQEFWDRIIEMTKDTDPTVRYQVLHNLCDGSPKAREDAVIVALESLHNDEDKYIRRRVHQVLSNYRKTGNWNIL